MATARLLQSLVLSFCVAAACVHAQSKAKEPNAKDPQATQDPRPSPDVTPPPARPAGEVARTPWTAAEARALANARRLLQNARNGREVRAPSNGLLMPGYRVVLFTRTEDGKVEATGRAGLADGLVVLAWPTPESTSSRGMLLHGDGTTMVCEIDAHSDTEAQPDMLVGRGSAGRFEDILRQPGTSAHGNFWFWLDQISERVQVRVVDERGAPRAGCHVEFCVAHAIPRLRRGAPLPAGRWPVGGAATRSDGRCTVAGPIAAELGVAVTLDHRTWITAGLRAELVDDRLEITVSDRAIRRARAPANEAAAMATLKNIASAQAQCQASRAIDADEDGAGEHGYFAELAGRTVVRGPAGTRIQPPLLSAAFANVHGSVVTRSGYHFCIYLPGEDGIGLPEAATGGAANRAVEPDLAEIAWCAYAWPTSKDAGTRVFFVDGSSDVLAAANADEIGDPIRFGAANPPPFDAAFRLAGSMLGKPATDATSADGTRWAIVR